MTLYTTPEPLGYCVMLLRGACSRVERKCSSKALFQLRNALHRYENAHVNTNKLATQTWLTIGSADYIRAINLLRYPNEYI